MRHRTSTAHKISALERATKRKSGGLSVLLAATSLLGASVGFVPAAMAAPAPSAPPETIGVSVGETKPAGHTIRLASQLPKISTPQVHVNIGTHVNTGNVHPVTSANSNAVKIGGANSQSIKTTNAKQFDKNNNNAGQGNNNTSGGRHCLMCGRHFIKGTMTATKNRGQGQGAGGGGGGGNGGAANIEPNEHLQMNFNSLK
jgi:hypothetical protein